MELSLISHRLWFILLICASLLTACGGGGAKSKSDANTAPTMTGVFTLNAKAQSSSTLIINVSDKENDSLQVSVENKPSWITTELANNQLTLVATPSFFEMGEHRLAVTISDGKASTPYTLTVNVADNKDKWQNLPLTASKITGQWQLSDGGRLYVFPNGEARLVDKDHHFLKLTWSENASEISLEESNPSCTDSYCTRYYSLHLVAEKAGQLHLVFSDDNNYERSFTAKRYESLTLSDGNYNLDNSLINDTTNKISGNGTRLDFNVNLRYPEIGERFLYVLTSAFNTQTANLAASNKAISFANAENTQTSSAYFLNSSKSVYEKITFTLTYEDVKALPASEQDLVLHFVATPKLAAESKDINIQDFFELDNFLASKHTYFTVSHLAAPAESPSIAAGDQFYFPLVPVQWDFLTYTDNQQFSSASLVVFETSNSGYVSLKTELFATEYKKYFTWTRTKQSLRLRFLADLTSVEYTFSKAPDGSLVAYVESALLKRTAMGEIVKVVSGTVPPLDLNNTVYYAQMPPSWDDGSFTYSIYLDSSDYSGHALIGLSTYNGDYDYKLSFWRVEADKSVSFINKDECLGSTYDECESELKEKLANGQLLYNLTYYNHKVIKKSGAIYKLLITTRYWQKDSSGDFKEFVFQRLEDVSDTLENFAQ